MRDPAAKGVRLKYRSAPGGKPSPRREGPWTRSLHVRVVASFEAANAYTRRARSPLGGPSPRATVAPMRPDPTYKDIFSHAFMVEELMRWLVADLHGARALVEALDFSGLERVHEQSVTSHGDEQHRHANDMVWRAPFRERDEDDEDDPGAWLYLVVMLEFQSEVDFLMPLRIRHYVDSLHLEQWRGRRFRSTDRLAPVLPIVLYTGSARRGARRRGSSTW